MIRMYRCNDCKHEFFTPKAVEESRGEFWGMPCTETMYYCPACGSEDYEEFTTEEEPVTYWVSAYTQYGDPFGDMIEAGNTDELFKLFEEKYPGCEIADYGVEEE